jgi:hypothetical protein
MDPAKGTSNTVVDNQGQKSPKKGSFNPKLVIGITCIVLSVLGAIAAAVLSLSFGMVLIPIIVGAVSAAFALTGIALTVTGKNEDPATLLAALSKEAKEYSNIFIKEHTKLEFISFEEQEATDENRGEEADTTASSDIHLDASKFIETRCNFNLFAITTGYYQVIDDPNKINICGIQTAIFNDIFNPFYTIVPIGKKGILEPKTDKEGNLIEKALKDKGKKVPFVCSQHGTSVFMVHLSAVDLRHGISNKKLKESLAFNVALVSYRALFSKALDLAKNNPDKRIEVNACMIGHGCLNDSSSIKRGYLKAAKEFESLFLQQANIGTILFVDYPQQSTRDDGSQD